MALCMQDLGDRSTRRHIFVPEFNGISMQVMMACAMEWASDMADISADAGGRLPILRRGIVGRYEHLCRKDKK
eukprot:349951-Chlamydomonas_euryale.AAC.4